MGISRSSFYALAADKPDDTKIVVEMKAIADEFEAYGYRRMTAELRHRGLVASVKKARRLMRENNLNPRHRRRYGRDQLESRPPRISSIDGTGERTAVQRPETRRAANCQGRQNISPEGVRAGLPER